MRKSRGVPGMSLDSGVWKETECLRVTGRKEETAAVLGDTGLDRSHSSVRGNWAMKGSKECWGILCIGNDGRSVRGCKWW